MDGSAYSGLEHIDGTQTALFEQHKASENVGAGSLIDDEG